MLMWQIYTARVLPVGQQAARGQSHSWHGQQPGLQGEYTGPSSTQEEDMGVPEFSIPNFHYSSIS